MQAQPVLEIISNRLTYRQLGIDARADGHRLCLAVQGGAMRGILSMGMLLALKDLKMLDIFDLYTSISAGSLNLAYALAGQGAMGLSVYFDEMTKAENLSLKRVGHRDHPILDMRSIYTKVLKQKALNMQELAGTYADSFYITVTNVTTGSGELINLRTSGNRFEEFLVAGATIPVISGEPWKINNQDYYDGGLFYADPARAAQDLGATHVLVLNTTYEGFEQKPGGIIIDYIGRRLEEEYPAAGEEYKRALAEYYQVFNRLAWGETDLNDMRLYRHALKHKGEVGRVTTDPVKLMHGVRAGYQSILDLFQSDAVAGIVPTIL